MEKDLEMRFKMFVFMVVILLIVVGVILVRNDGKGEWHDFSLKHDGLERTYKVYVPNSYHPDVGGWPVVLNFHGGFGNAEAAERQTQMSVTAEENGFVLVYPEAVIGGESDSGKNYQHWNGGPRIDSGKAPDVDDVSFISALLDDLKKKYNIDLDRVYATGISNGGTMVYRLACQLSDEIAAVAVVEANQLEIDCNPNRAVSIMHVHGMEDKFFPYSGGVSEEISDNLQPVEETVLDWAERNGCSIEPVEYSEVNGCTTYGGCERGVEVVLCLLENQGHTWPGPGVYAGARTCESDPEGNLCNILKNVTGPRRYDFNVNDKIWEFFENKSL